MSVGQIRYQSNSMYERVSLELMMEHIVLGQTSNTSETSNRVSTP